MSTGPLRWLLKNIALPWPGITTCVLPGFQSHLSSTTCMERMFCGITSALMLKCPNLSYAT